MSATLQDVVRALDKHELGATSISNMPTVWRAHCPACCSWMFPEDEPPLTVSQNGSGPKLLCASGCAPIQILEELGLRVAAATRTVRDAERLRCAETDMGNARRLVLDHQDVLRYVPGIGWLCWDDTRWVLDGDGEAMRLAKATVRGIRDEATALSDVADRFDDAEKRAAAKKKAGERLAHAKRSQAQPRLEALLKCASSEAEFVLHADRLDADAMLLNTPGGTVDLRTGELREHRPGDHITKLAGTTPDAAAPAPLWDGYLRTTFAGDAALIDCFRRRVGYSLSGDIREQAIFFAAGDGANGKTTGLETIAAAMGDYATSVDPVSFTTAASDRAARSDIARLPGARMVLGSEIDEGAHLAKPLLKQLSGGDKIVARHLYKAEFEFRPVMKIWLTVNHLPRVGSDDHAIWRRLQVIPFDVRIERPDKALGRKLRAELPGILAWALQGCRDWQRNGLGSCPAIDRASAGYRRREDRLTLFLDECCELDEHARVDNGALRDAYHAWERARGGVPVSDLFEQLDKRGFQTGKSNGRRVRKGLRLTGDAGPVEAGEQR